MTTTVNTCRSMMSFFDQMPSLPAVKLQFCERLLQRLERPLLKSAVDRAVLLQSINVYFDTTQSLSFEGQDHHVMPCFLAAVWGIVVPTIGILQSETHPTHAHDLIDRLSLPVLPDLRSARDYSHLLSVEPYQLGETVDTAVGLRTKDPHKPKFTMKPIYVDFCPPTGSKLAERGKQTDLLVQAVGPPGRTVLDATAGLGQDAYLLARSGAASVQMVERDPVLSVLLEDAIRRLSLLASAGNPAAQRLSSILSLTSGDFLELETLGESVDVVYLDPMFPKRKKTASVKKNMQVLQNLVESYNDENLLMQRALGMAQSRVVVKRPIHADPLGGQPPNFAVKGSINRFDVYLTETS